MSKVTFTHKGEKVELEVNLRGRPLKGETSEQATARKVAAAKKEYRASVA